MDRFAAIIPLALVFLVACGDEETSSEPPPSAPEFDAEAFSLQCAPAESDDRFDGQFVSAISASVSDVDFDLTRVTAVVSGTTLDLTWTRAGEDGASTGEVLGTDAEDINLRIVAGEIEKTAHVWSRAGGDAPLRCTSGASVVFRAVDALGNVTVEELNLP